MVKSFVSRSTFRLLTLALNTPQTIAIEGDECLAQVLTSGQSVQITRQREATIVQTFPTHTAVTAANSTLVKPIIDATMGMVRLDSNTTVTSLNNSLSPYHSSVGMKENVTFNMYTGTGTVDVLIETRHYVPADELTI